MSGDSYGDVAPGCDHPARELLDFYLNGTLEGGEEAVVRAHLETCAACAAELGELSQLAAAIAGHGTVPETPWSRRRARLRWLGVAAALVATASATVFLIDQRRSGARLGSETGPVELRLDLATGAMRDSGSPQVVTVRPGAGTLRLTLFPPVQPGAKYLARVRGVGGDVILREEPLSSLDAMGRAAILLPVEELAPGSYEVLLRVESADGGSRSFTYPFDVHRAGRRP